MHRPPPPKKTLIYLYFTCGLKNRRRRIKKTDQHYIHRSNGGSDPPKGPRPGHENEPPPRPSCFESTPTPEHPRQKTPYIWLMMLSPDSFNSVVGKQKNTQQKTNTLNWLMMLSLDSFNSVQVGKLNNTQRKTNTHNTRTRKKKQNERYPFQYE